MSERDYFESDTVFRLAYIHDKYYAATVQELLYNAMSLANPDSSIRQPTTEEGPQTIELIPVPQARQNCEDIIPSWDSVIVIVHPAGKTTPEEEYKGEVQATILLCQQLDDPDGKLDPTSLEFHTQVNIYLRHGTYFVEKENALCDFEELSEPVIAYENSRIVSIDELADLNMLICESPTRPVGL